MMMSAPKHVGAVLMSILKSFQDNSFVHHLVEKTLIIIKMQGMNVKQKACTLSVFLILEYSAI
jgi:hypothetical protein